MCRKTYNSRHIQSPGAAHPLKAIKGQGRGGDGFDWGWEEGIEPIPPMSIPQLELFPHPTTDVNCRKENLQEHFVLVNFPCCPQQVKGMLGTTAKE